MTLSELEKGRKTGLSIPLTRADKVEDFFKGIKVYSLYNDNLFAEANSLDLQPVPEELFNYTAVKFLERTKWADKRLLYTNEVTLQLLHNTWLQLAADLEGSPLGVLRVDAAARHVTDTVCFDVPLEDRASGGGSNRSSPKSSPSKEAPGGGSDAGVVPGKVEGRQTRLEGASPKAVKNMSDSKEPLVRGIVHELPVRVPGQYSGQQENCFLTLHKESQKWLRNCGYEAKMATLEDDILVEKQLVKEVVAFGAANIRTLWGTDYADAKELMEASNIAVDMKGGLRAASFKISSLCSPENIGELKGTVYTTRYLQFLKVPPLAQDPSTTGTISPGEDFVEGLELILNLTTPDLLTKAPTASTSTDAPIEACTAEHLAKRLGTSRAKLALAAVGDVAEHLSDRARAKATAEEASSLGLPKEFLGRSSHGMSLPDDLRFRLLEQRLKEVEAERAELIRGLRILEKRRYVEAGRQLYQETESQQKRQRTTEDAR